MRKVLLIILGVIVLGVIVVGAWLYVIPNLSKENRQIKSWISENNFNDYGDPLNTVYSNGKPCDNTLDCFQYIKAKNPEKPWEQ